MPSLEVTVDVKLDGASIPGFPQIRRATVTEAVPLDNMQQAADNNSTSFHQVVGSQMATLQALVLTADQAINLKFNNASYLPLNANGLVVIFGANVAAGASTNATINVPGATVADVTGISAGS